MKSISAHHHKSEKGNILALFGLAIAALATILGMVVPTHSAYIPQDTLQLGVEAAAQAASEHFVRDYTIDAMQQAAQNKLDLYGIQPQSLAIETCDTVAAEHGLTFLNDLTQLVTIDPAVCNNPPRKLVRVRVTAPVQPNGLPATVESVAEAASLDVALVIDTSESMTFGWNKEMTGDNRDPSRCNMDDPTGSVDGIPGSCFPFQDIKQTAAQFIENLYFPYDRVSVVAFAQDAEMILPMSGDQD